jgi:outer membrane usher protein
MGAAVEDETGKPLATVDPGGRALVLSERDSGQLVVKWTDQTCRATFALPPKEAHRSFDRLKVLCQ